MSDVVTRNRNKPKDPIATVPKRDVFIVLPYLGLQSKFSHKATYIMNSLFPYKDRLNRSLKSKVVYKAGGTRLAAAGTVMTFTSVKRA